MEYKSKEEFDNLDDYYKYLAEQSPCGNSAKLIMGRLRRICGWTVHRAVTEPKGKKNHNHYYRNGSYVLNQR